MLKIVQLLLVILFAGCDAISKKPKSIEIVTAVARQDSLFQSLIDVTNNALPDSIQNDSLAFMVLPVQASCPSCREKTVDSILKHKNSLLEKHFIIISASAGRKTMNSYFLERDADIPFIPQLILDSNNISDKHNLYENNPAMYYSANRKVYKKVLAVPATVKQDLQEFFTGWRSDENQE